MLDHDEERRLAEIEARLRDEAPDLLELFDEIPDSPAALGPIDPLDALSRDEPADGAADAGGGQLTTHPWLKSAAAVTAAVVLTTLVTLAIGPDLGGLVGVIGLSISGMYAYQVLRGCPGLRHRRH
jgi:hypothetical protein